MPRRDRCGQSGALIGDVYQRGLDKRLMVFVTGEFGRTPRFSHVASSGQGIASAPSATVQAGRDHWSQAGWILFAAGRIRTGQVIGATDSPGGAPVARRVAIRDFTGRPTPIIHQAQATPNLGNNNSYALLHRRGPLATDW
jgi:Protein of unknown function (DUF1501)